VSVAIAIILYAELRLLIPVGKIIDKNNDNMISLIIYSMEKYIYVSIYFFTFPLYIYLRAEIRYWRYALIDSSI
jgi:hypothetical protein